MRRDDVPEGRAVEEHVVPREGKAKASRSPAEMNVGDHPRAVGEVPEMRRCVLAKGPEDARDDELRSGDDDAVGDVALEAGGRDVEDGELDAIVARHDVRDEASRLDAVPRGARQVTYQTPIALGPREERRRLGAARRHARGEVKEHRPRARVLGRCTVVVATGVVDVPAEARARVTAASHVRRRGDPVELGERRVGGAATHRHGERATAPRVATLDPFVDVATEACELGEIDGARAVRRGETLTPRSVDEEPLLGIADERRLDGANVGRAGSSRLELTHLVE